jgi:hypothetical protein
MTEHYGQLNLRGGDVKNCLNAAAVYAYEDNLRMSADKSKFAVWPAPTTSDDRNIYGGEMMFEQIKGGAPRSTTHDPLVRSCCNGWMSSYKPRANGDDDDYDDQLAEFREQIRLTGYARLTSIWNAEVGMQTTSPVAVLAGTMTIPNTGPFQIQTGDIIVCIPPWPGMTTSQAPKDYATPMTQGRRVLQTVPLRCLLNPNDPCDKKNTCKLFNSKEIKQMMKSKKFNKLVCVISELMTEFSLAVGMAVDQTIPMSQSDLKILRAKIQKAREDNPVAYKLEKEKTCKIVTNLMKLLAMDEPKGTKNGMEFSAREFVDATVPISSTIIHAVGSLITGVAQSSTKPLSPFDITISPIVATTFSSVWT